MTEPVAYELTRAYQLKLLALCLRLPGFLQDFRSCIRAEWFEDPTLADVARLALAKSDELQTSPTLDMLAQAVEDVLVVDARRREKAEDYIGLLVDLGSVEIEQERPDIERRIVQFARSRALVAALLQSADDLEQGKTDGIEPRMREALEVGQQASQEDSLDYWADRSRFAYDRASDAVTTGLPDLDRELSGGLAAGELGVIEAPAKRFKTGTLVNFGAAALKAGVDVVHFSLEINAKTVGRRYDKRITQALPESTPLVERMALVERAQALYTGTLLIRGWPLGTATVADLRAQLMRWQRNGQIALGERQTLIIVDYGQILKPERMHAEKRHEHREAYQALLRLASAWPHTRVWTAMQSNRESVDRKVIGIKHLSECFAVAADAHMILSLNQTAKEAEDNTLRIFVAACREAASFGTVEVTVDPALMTLIPRRVGLAR